MSKTVNKIHFIAIGGSVMHNLAIALHQRGHQVSGSDDYIFDPSKGKLAQHGLLPDEFGWFPEKITDQTDFVILGMHARPDNPELKKAQNMGIKIYSYPEYIYQSFADKQRVVVGGSHGKTTITAMLLHVFKYHGLPCDYIVGAQLAGYNSTVKITADAPVAIIEGDEYLSSPIDRTSKFLHYRPHIGCITGIAWDHINIFKTFEAYTQVFAQFADTFVDGGKLFFNTQDPRVAAICREPRKGITQTPYQEHPHKIVDNQTVLLTEQHGEVKVKLFGNHNMQNLAVAKAMCLQLNLSEAQFYEAIPSFTGASRRMEKIAENNDKAVFKDFAHAPSKVTATTQALKKQYADRNLVACLELHTFSSLNKDFLGQYHNALQKADTAVVFFNPEAIALKKLETINADDIKAAFGQSNLTVFDQSTQLVDFLHAQSWDATNLLMMSSGNFDNLDLKLLAEEIVSN
ncbi:UDP-N-acetylmuramate--L-alanine ligase [Microscilla marina]|uniref:Mur ligase family, catalytic domain protein n=1 Tax=Microscilla marina ATCC 23134 TaxID=313606 RepID=A1ZE81_MICM2|nr:Mur ligase family protein [Microscilla marina]EAY31389.1 Mur ligase family, catalytic domain protein [Microscilla marina ATCC 23134]